VESSVAQSALLELISPAEAPLCEQGNLLCTPERGIEGPKSLLGADIFLAFGALACLSAVGCSAWLIAIGAVGKTFTVVSSPGTTSNDDYAATMPLLLSFLPTLLAMIFNLIWYNLDLIYRAHQPFANMRVPALAKDSILLDYLSPVAPQVIMTAIGNSHWRVALFSTLKLLRSTTAIPFAYVFQQVPGPDGTQTAVSKRDFYMALTILIIWTGSLLTARPPAAYRLPRPLQDLASLILLCYASGLDSDPEYAILAKDDTREHLFARVLLAKHRFQFGFYLGTDFRRHLGFDQAYRGEQDPVEVNTCRTHILPVKPGSAFYHFWIRTKRCRHPTIIPPNELKKTL
jgi:hypothetical protein